jgi:hypothetical protein
VPTGDVRLWFRDSRFQAFAIIAGYRAPGYNYRQNGTILDLISHGPYGGIEITLLGKLDMAFDWKDNSP